MAKLARNGRYKRVPSDVAWIVVDRLLALNWSSQAIASATNLSWSTLEKALQDRKNGRPYTFGPALAAALVKHGDPTAGSVGVTGARRRLQGLARQGYSLVDLANETGLGWTTLAAIRNGDTKLVRATAHVIIRDTANRLTMSIGPSPAARAHAEKMKWPGLLAWDDIDNPDEGKPSAPSPRGQRRPRKSRAVGIPYDRLDEGVIVRLLSGERVDSSPAEKREAMRRWTLIEGRSERQLCLIHGWKPGRYRTQEDVAS